MTEGLLTAAIEHGPGMHGGIVGVVALVLIGVAVVGGLIYREGRKRSERERAGDGTPETSKRGPER